LASIQQTSPSTGKIFEGENNMIGVFWMSGWRFPPEPCKWQRNLDEKRIPEAAPGFEKGDESHHPGKCDRVLNKKGTQGWFFSRAVSPFTEKIAPLLLRRPMHPPAPRHRQPRHPAPRSPRAAAPAAGAVGCESSAPPPAPARFLVEF